MKRILGIIFIAFFLVLFSCKDLADCKKAEDNAKADCKKRGENYEAKNCKEDRDEHSCEVTCECREISKGRSNSILYSRAFCTDEGDTFQYFFEVPRNEK